MHKLLLVLLLFACTPSSVPLTAMQRAKREEAIVELLRQGTVALRRNNSESLEIARAKLALARELKPDDPRVIDALGCLAWQEGSDELAEFYFQRAVELEPEYDRGYAHLALVSEKRGENRKALALYQKALSLNPLNHRARNNYAILLRERGDIVLKRRAREELRKLPIQK